MQIPFSFDRIEEGSAGRFVAQQIRILDWSRIDPSSVLLIFLYRISWAEDSELGLTE